jgi:agmatinase
MCDGFLLVIDPKEEALPQRHLFEECVLILEGDGATTVSQGGHSQTFEWMAEQEMRWHTMNEVHERGLSAVIDDAIEEATASPKGIYLSVDIDVLDPGFAPGTGTPEPGGLTSSQLLGAIRRIVASVELVGADIVEVSPPYDGPGAITAEVANRVGLEIISALAKKAKDAETKGTA